MTIYKTGKLPAQPMDTAIRFGDIFTNLPVPPPVFGHEALMGDQPWNMLGNDEFGNCVWAAAAHDMYLWSLMGGRPRIHITTLDTLLDYGAVTGFQIGDKSTDKGTEMSAAVEYYRTVGIRDSSGERHPISSYVALNPGDTDQLATAVYLFGAIDIGISISSAQSQQFEQGVPWHSTMNPFTGGHCVPIVGRNSEGNFLCVTWGRLQAITPEFIQKNMDEGYAYLSENIIGLSGLSPENFNQAELTKMLSQLASARTARVMAEIKKDEYSSKYAAVAAIEPSPAQFEAAFEALRADINNAGYGAFISDETLRPFSDAVAVAVVTAV
jgi:hypothetical protein